ncbi:uncharacterized protein LOC115717660 [Cannabis sativa]|uniref:uncharacterized protein LOC115717660 n=1 Tax=Cannabis sativa TaxID=3483 RepID=UPI0029CA75A0|nr:uncharacterized protein LOC115717660 [Cannabis sativa]
MQLVYRLALLLEHLQGLQKHALVNSPCRRDWSRCDCGARNYCGKEFKNVAWKEWEERLTALEGTIRRQNEELRQLRHQPELPIQIRPPEPDPPAAVRFRKQHPPEFEGGIDRVVAEEWMSRIERILQMLRVDGNDRVKCASYILRKDARILWEVVEQTKNVDTMNWDDFKRVFNEKYYNSTVLAAKVNEFTGLAQGSLTVTEYARKFDRLAKFAPDLVPTDRVLYAQVVEMALTAERSENKIWKENADRRESKKGGANSNDHKKRGQDHSGQSSHDIRAQNPTNNYVPARIFGITQVEVEASPSVVSGQIPMANTTCKVLFESGATHSFFASTFVNHINAPSELFPVGFWTMLPSGEVVISRNWLRGIPVTIDGRELFIDLIVLDLFDFDVILGMDFHTKYGASIDCKQKKVVFTPEDGEKFEFRAAPLLFQK